MNWEIRVERGERLLDGNHGIGKLRLEEASVCWMEIKELANGDWKR